MIHSHELASLRATRAARSQGRALPVLRRGEAPTPAGEQALAEAAVAARAGDPVARDALYEALAQPIAVCVARYRRRASRAGVWDLDDVRQEAYLAFVETLEEWSGQPPFFGFFAIRFPRRLADAVQRLDRRMRPPAVRGGTHLLHDDSAAAAASLALLEGLAATLPEPDGAILLLRIRDGQGFGTIARGLGLSRRTVCRRWGCLRELLRASLTGQNRAC